MLACNRFYVSIWSERNCYPAIEFTVVAIRNENLFTAVKRRWMAVGDKDVVFETEKDRGHCSNILTQIVYSVDF